MDDWPPASAIISSPDIIMSVLHGEARKRKLMELLKEIEAFLGFFDVRVGEHVANLAIKSSMSILFEPFFFSIFLVFCGCEGICCILGRPLHFRFFWFCYFTLHMPGSDGVGQKQHVLQDKLRECHDALSAELTKMDKQRESSDRQIESLENKKLILRQKLQTIDEKLHAAREVQRSCFEQRDACCKAVADVEGQFRSQLQKAEDEGLQATREHNAAKEALVGV